ncbi:unannotated protein [freshwater metagenome]|uniref:Unannotated protein n=1 Tax=freshwater metagenome TaxID=449393 RepID=A0A6J6I5X0_9ZZZZ
MSLAITAAFMGLRAKATAMPVIKSTLSVAAAPNVSGRNGSWEISTETTPSNPASSARHIAAAASARFPWMIASVFMAPF